ncbi:UPF0586 protein C9orf41-like protein [Smittium culicis]|uniref:carnosine N-methyltransferase n=1 Tax=Smittium culicis TaxID=133412 RepID=A0A1R1X0J3_9FUNG|nr:UPF0586 protein C9orf41-like protein [Smittium culicis]
MPLENFPCCTPIYLFTYHRYFINCLESWNVVVTCFFIDTAKNPVSYLKTIYNTLEKGGMWINFGPLQWHFENTPGELSIELTYEEVLDLVQKIGFEIKNKV